jgi:hypothetical protein
MQHSNGNNPPTPPEPGDTPEWVPTPEQPWRPVTGDDSGAPYQFDYGAPWCADRAGHPQFQEDGYPSLNHHRTECRSYDGWFGALMPLIECPQGCSSNVPTLVVVSA